MDISNFQKLVYENACEKGFYDKPVSAPAGIALLHSEVSEALDAWNRGEDDAFAEELADVVILALSLAAHYGIDMRYELIRKHMKNLERPFRHGGGRI